jgi:hypothetical protein
MYATILYDKCVYTDINYNDNIQNTFSTTSEQDEVDILTRSNIIIYLKKIKGRPGFVFRQGLSDILCLHLIQI